MLGQKQAFLLVRLRDLAARVLERLAHRHPSVTISIGLLGGERLDEVLRKLRFVSLAARFRRGDDDTPGPGERLEKGAAGACRIDEDQALAGKLVEELRPFLGGQVGAGQVERRFLPVEAAVSEQNHEDLVFALHARGEIPEYFFDALPRRTALDELRIDLGLLREINNVVLRN